MDEPIPLLYETPDLIAVDKPAGMVVIPARGEEAERSIHKRLERERGETLWVVHRLDRETSGVLLFARSAEAHRAWSMAFEGGRVEKEYLALTAGVPRMLAVRAPIIESGHAMAVAAPGQRGAKPSETRLTVVRRWPAHDVCLVRCLPLTGRRHQIRVHLAHAGAPILADPVYGTRGCPWPIARTALHAARLVPPSALGCDEITAPLPADFIEVLAALG